MILTALQNAIVERWLDSDALTDALGGPYVFARDWPPPPDPPEVDPLPKPGSPYRYITVGDKTEGFVGVLGTDGFSATLTAHVWTVGYYGEAEVEEVYSLMMSAIVESPIALDGYGPVALKREFAAVVADPDPERRHINVRWRFFTIAEIAA